MDEADVGVQGVVLCERAEVVEQGRLGAEVLGPVAALGERVAVEVVGDVDATPRIDVLQPGPAHVVVLLDDDVVDAGLVEPVGGQQPGHAGTDHHHLQRSIRIELVGPPVRSPLVGARGAQLLVQEGQVVVGRVLAGQEVHQRTQLGVGGHATSRPRFRRGAPAGGVAQGEDRLESQLLAGGALVGGQAAVRVAHLGRIGPQVVAEQRKIARGVGQRGQQRHHCGASDRSPDRLVVGIGRYGHHRGSPKLHAPEATDPRQLSLR